MVIEMLPNLTTRRGEQRKLASCTKKSLRRAGTGIVIHCASKSILIFIRHVTDRELLVLDDDLVEEVVGAGQARLSLLVRARYQPVFQNLLHS